MHGCKLLHNAVHTINKLLSVAYTPCEIVNKEIGNEFCKIL